MKYFVKLDYVYYGVKYITFQLTESLEKFTRAAILSKYFYLEYGDGVCDGKTGQTRIL